MYLYFETGMEKINFSGGEPFLHEKGDFLGELVQFCKEDLQLPSVSIVSNGSMIKERWFQKYGKTLHSVFCRSKGGTKMVFGTSKTLFCPSGDYLDILAISCDSFCEDTNQLIGRAQGRKSHIENLYKIRHWCRQYRVAFKINTVVNTFNVDEDMQENITKLDPVRWKVRHGRAATMEVHARPPALMLSVCVQVFQCLLIDGENAGEEALREAERFVISDGQFQDFLDKHSSVSCLVPESNEKVGRASVTFATEKMLPMLKPADPTLDVGIQQPFVTEAGLERHRCWRSLWQQGVERY